MLRYALTLLLVLALVETSRASIDVEFSVLTPQATGLEAAVQFGAQTYPPSPVIPVEILTLSLSAATDPLPVKLNAQVGGGGIDAIVHFGAANPSSDVIPFGSFFDVFVDELPFRGSSPVSFPPSPIIPAPDPNLPGVSFFDVFFEVEIDEGTAMHTMHFFTEQAGGFTNIQVEQGNSFHVSFNLDSNTPGNTDNLQPLFTVTTSATFVPIPEPTTLIIWSLLATLGLSVGWRRRRTT